MPPPSKTAPPKKKVQKDDGKKVQKDNDEKDDTLDDEKDEDVSRGKRRKH